MKTIGRWVAPLALSAFLAGPAAAANKMDFSQWGSVTATLEDNAATKALVAMLPVTISMRDLLRQEKTGNLPKSLPEMMRQRDFAPGTLGLWSSDHLVIYYRAGSVPDAGIIILGHAAGDFSLFDRPDAVTVRVEEVK